jgi:hypothetical protein
MTADEIAALAITLQAHTPAHILSSMELRTVLDFMKGRGFLRRPVEPWVCATCRATAIKETTR